jgi:hypothetical protein
MSMIDVAQASLLGEGFGHGPEEGMVIIGALILVVVFAVGLVISLAILVALGTWIARVSRKCGAASQGAVAIAARRSALYLSTAACACGALLVIGALALFLSPWVLQGGIVGANGWGDLRTNDSAIALNSGASMVLGIVTLAFSLVPAGIGCIAMGARRLSS